MANLPKRYRKMKRDKLIKLALGGDQSAQDALQLHQRLDRLIDQMELQGKQIDSLLPIVNTARAAKR